MSNFVILQYLEEYIKNERNGNYE